MRDVPQKIKYAPDAQNGSSVTNVPIKAAVVIFPGSNCDHDMVWALRNIMKFDVTEVWHQDSVPDDIEFIAIPGGFSYGDYLRAGSLASMSKVMTSVREHAEKGTTILGVCNGFQILLESGLLPGALRKNIGMKFRCMNWDLSVENTHTAFTSDLEEGDVISLPIAHGYGNYYLPPGDLDLYQRQILFRYCDKDGNINPDTNPNGSIESIAGITNKKGNVLGMMPHPERAVETLLGGTDGLKIFRSIENYVRQNLTTLS